MARFILILSLFAKSLLGQTSPIPARDAFVFSYDKVGTNQIVLSIDIKKGFSLYQDKFRIKPVNDNMFNVTAVKYPPSVSKKLLLNQVKTVYRDTIKIPVSMDGKLPGNASLMIQYQGCSDSGYCYPPQKQTIGLVFDDQLKLAIDQQNNPPGFSPETQAGNKNETNQVEQILSSSHLVMALLVFFGFGLLLAFTPCVLPMVPVLSCIIIGHGQQMTSKKAFLISLSYVISMALTYAVVGAIVALAGTNLQLIMQSSWVIACFSLLFVLLSLAMFGAFELKLPVSWQSKLSLFQRRYAGGQYVGAAVMGCLSTLILSPCVTAPLIGALSYIAHTGNILFGSLALFCLGLGMGTPLLLIGTSAGRFLPKTGAWMNQIKSFFGIILIAIAIFLATRILPGFVVMGLWAGLLIFSGIYVGAFQINPKPVHRLRQTIGIVLFAYGFLIILGAAMGSIDPIKPLSVFAEQTRIPAGIYQPTVVTSEKALHQTIKQAGGKPILVDFYAEWCQTCQVMEKTIFKTPELQQALTQFHVIKADVTQMKPSQQAMLKQYMVIAPPTFIFLDRHGNELKQLRLYGSQSKTALIANLNSALSG